MSDANQLRSVSGSGAEDLFIELFTDVFGAERAAFLYSQYPFMDIYQNCRFADFVLDNGMKKLAIEIDDEATHNPRAVSFDKFSDDLLKQNSMTYLGWFVYRWAVRQMQRQPDTIKDELRVFFGNSPRFREIADYLPEQRGKSISGGDLTLHDHQREALRSLQQMRANHETIALLYHATGTGKTVTAVLDAKACGGRTLFLAHTKDIVRQAQETFKSLWPEQSTGLFLESQKENNTHIVCGSIQSVVINLDLFHEDAFDYLIVDEAHHAAAETYQKVLAYFQPKFTLGLTATPERTDE
ncbi:MAG: DEAD/DEAH box helicase family protein, partial [Planctomycetia bacterium]|nr:DEAD/DEAH box helicase family protein [Planctomycetia bacterium]